MTSLQDAAACLPEAPPVDPLPRAAREVGVVTHVAYDFQCVNMDQVWQHTETGALKRVVCCLLEKHGIIVLNERALEAWEPRGFLEKHVFLGAVTVTLPMLAASPSA